MEGIKSYATLRPNIGGSTAFALFAELQREEARVRFIGTSDTRGSGGWVGGVGWTSVSFGDAGGVGGWGEVRGRAAIAYCFWDWARTGLYLVASALMALIIIKKSFTKEQQNAKQPKSNTTDA